MRPAGAVAFGAQAVRISPSLMTRLNVELDNAGEEKKEERIDVIPTNLNLGPMATFTRERGAEPGHPSVIVKCHIAMGDQNIWMGTDGTILKATSAGVNQPMPLAREKARDAVQNLLMEIFPDLYNY
jgi:hypothetical protein